MVFLSANHACASKYKHRDPLRGVVETNLIERVRPGSDNECVVLPRMTEML